jgi:hypothetical protein
MAECREQLVVTNRCDLICAELPKVPVARREAAFSKSWRRIKEAPGVPGLE